MVGSGARSQPQSWPRSTPTSQRRPGGHRHRTTRGNETSKLLRATRAPHTQTSRASARRRSRAGEFTVGHAPDGVNSPAHGRLRARCRRSLAAVRRRTHRCRALQNHNSHIRRGRGHGGQARRPAKVYVLVRITADKALPCTHHWSVSAASRRDVKASHSSRARSSSVRGQGSPRLRAPARQPAGPRPSPSVPQRVARAAGRSR